MEVLVVGAGQAGVAMSEHLSRAGIPHLVLERDRIAERWRSGRWDSLVANGPAWHDRFPGWSFPAIPEAFAPKEEVADYFVAYAEKIAAPIRCGVEVTEVTRLAGRRRLPRRDLATATIEAGYVVAATGPFQRPIIPPIVPENAGLVQMHSAAYRNPDQLPEGRRAGGRRRLLGGADRRGACERGARSSSRSARTTGRRAAIAAATTVWWLGVLNKWDAEAAADHRACHHRGERRPRRPDGRLPPSRRARGDARRPGAVVRDGRDRLPPELRRNLATATPTTSPAGRSRRLRRPQRPRPAGGAGGAGDRRPTRPA